jgi:multidrug efflux pump subunit AcrA (membrane-fusion protein)
MVEETRTLEARVELDNKAGLLKPGMYVTAHIADNEDEHAKEMIAVPLSSLQRLGEVPVVFVVKAPGVYERRAVTLGQRYGDWQEVLVGLEAGEMVVTEGSFTLKSELLRSQMGHSH